MYVDAPQLVIKTLEAASSYVSLASGFPRFATMLPAQTGHPEAYVSWNGGRFPGLEGGSSVWVHRPNDPIHQS